MKSSELPLIYLALNLLFLLCETYGQSCSQPFTCMDKESCLWQHGGEDLHKKVLFRCSRRSNYICCPPPKSATVVNFPQTGQTQINEHGQTHIDIGGQSPVGIRITSTTTTTRRPPVTIPTSHRNINLLPSSCGLSLDLKITGGENAEPGQYPWMALVVFKSRKGKELFKCGGTLINDRYVLTAAHCFDSKEDTLSYVRLGEFQISKLEECVDGQCTRPADIPVESKFIHEKWGSEDFRNDIALLRLSKNVSALGRGDIVPICLPMNITALNITDTTQFEAAGWGIVSWTEFSNSDILQRTNFTNNEKDCSICDGIQHRFCPISEDQLCIQGTRKRDVCKGDSGGPLMVFHLATYQVGITSYKPTEVCGEEGVPSIFTRVDKYVNWILDHMEP